MGSVQVRGGARPSGSVARVLPGILPGMTARRPHARFRVRIEVPRIGGWGAWGAAAAAFEQRLTAQPGGEVAEAVLESEMRRGRDSVRIRVAVTVTAPDPGQAALTAWRVFIGAAGEDVAAWDVTAASAEIRPAGRALTVAAAPRDVVVDPTAWTGRPGHAGRP